MRHGDSYHRDTEAQRRRVATPSTVAALWRGVSVGDEMDFLRDSVPLWPRETDHRSDRILH